MAAVGRGGKQRRRAKRNHWIAAISVLFIALCLIATCIAVLASYPTSEPEDERTVRWVVIGFGAFALLLLGLSWYLFRKARPAVARHLRLEVATPEVRRGGSVDVTLNVDRAPDPDCKLELALVCMEHYDVEEHVYNPNGADYEKRVTKTAEVRRDAKPIEGAEGPRRVTFTVPPDGPFSYEGDCISAFWKVQALERRPRRSDRSTEADVWVAP